ncbi:hypothetical protein FFWV33_16145 [Flavobacterium faecale]|uniref:Uncharacterized protein n=1 Tax=Flavobacterium faecale TaxID=1355330 RepID=A0A2S1LHH6_9FLAO|nr:hypothetical protein FFWV33_16145 [Flavobacterium faecale]
MFRFAVANLRHLYVSHKYFGAFFKSFLIIITKPFTIKYIDITFFKKNFHNTTIPKSKPKNCLKNSKFALLIQKTKQV